MSSAATPGLARTRTPAGTILRYSLSEDAEVTLRFYRALPGRRLRARCLAPTRRRARRCTRYPYRGKLVRRDVKAGRRLLRFSGRIGLRALPAGRYRVTLRARDAAQNLSQPRSAKFTVVRR